VPKFRRARSKRANESAGVKGRSGHALQAVGADTSLPIVVWLTPKVRAMLSPGRGENDDL
jgi:hypothetical protein